MSKFAIFLIVLGGIIQLPTFGQDGFAGPDKSLTNTGCVAEGEEVCVSIGTENDPKSCYEWTPTQGIKSPESGITDACPENTTTYKLTKTSPDGSVHIDYVKVEVITEIETIEAKPKKCCFTDGDVLKLSDFEFSPTGLEPCITLKTRNANHDIGGNQTVDFEYKSRDGTKTINFSCQIKVAPNVSAGTAVNIAEIVKVQQKVARVEYMVRRLKALASTATRFSSWGSSRNVDKGWTFELENTLGTTCCNTCDTYYFGVEWAYLLNGKFGASVQYDFAFYGIPYVATAGITAGVEGSVSFGVKGTYVVYCNEGSLSFPYKAGVGINGGLYAQIGNKWFNVARATLTINFSLEASSAVKVLPSPVKSGWDEISVCGDVKLVGQISFISSVTRKVEVTLVKACL